MYSIFLAPKSALEGVQKPAPEILVEACVHDRVDGAVGVGNIQRHVLQRYHIIVSLLKKKPRYIHQIMELRNN